jgi:hypothetical protein
MREDEEMRRTGVIQSERQVFEMARDYFGLDNPEGAAAKFLDVELKGDGA